MWRQDKGICEFMSDKIHCQKCAKQRLPNLFIESVPDKNGKTDRVYVKLKKIKELIQAKGFIKIFQSGIINNYCLQCHTVSQYKMSKEGKLVGIIQ